MSLFRFIKKPVTLITSTFVLLCAFTSSATAEYIQFTFSGEVTEIGGSMWAPWEDVFFGDPVMIQFIVDSNAADQTDGSDIGTYSFLDLSFSVSGDELITSQGFIRIMNEVGNSQDRFILSFDFSEPFIGIAMIVGPNMFQTDGLPTDVDWTQYGTSFVGAIGSLPDGTGTFEYELTQFDAVVIPAAPTLFVFLIGFCCDRRKQ